MKKLILSLIALFALFSVRAQTTADILKYETPKLAVDSIGEALADMALQNPDIKSAEDLTKSEEYTWRATKLSLLNDVTVAGNLNEYTLKKSSNIGVDGKNLLYPRYNFGVRVPIGELFSNAKTNKAAFYRFQSQAEHLKQVRLNIRKQVITAYQDYALTQKLIALEQEILQDHLVAFTKAEERFKNGEISLDGLTAASKNYNTEQVRLASLNRDLRVQQAALEELIGMPLEDAFDHIRSLYQGQADTNVPSSATKK